MKSTIIILAVLLLTSNAFWLYQVMDSGITLSYRDQQAYELEETRKQLMATFSEVAKDTKKEEIISVASKYTDQEVFEKDGCTWVGWLGFKFDVKNNLVSVSPSWSYGEKDPCFPDF